MSSRRLCAALAACLLLALPAASPSERTKHGLPSPAAQENSEAPGTGKQAGPPTAAFGAAVSGVSAPLLSCGYYEEASFLQSVNGIEAYPAKGDLRAGVVPHHLLAGRMIAAFFARAAQNETPYESVILVGPSHYATQNRITTARAGWKTPFGTLDNNLEFTRRLTENGQIAAAADEAAMEKDHAIAGLIPYVQYYLPGVCVSMVLLQNTAEEERVQALASEIAGYLKEKRALLVCSIDFSHYLMPEQTAQRDEETRRAIEEFDYIAVSHFNDDHVDSPHSLKVFMKNAEAFGQVHFLDQSSSDRILKLPPGDPVYQEGTTSYFVLAALLQGQ